MPREGSIRLQLQDEAKAREEAKMTAKMKEEEDAKAAIAEQERLDDEAERKEAEAFERHVLEHLHRQMGLKESRFETMSPMDKDELKKSVAPAYADIMVKLEDHDPATLYK